MLLLNNLKREINSESKNDKNNNLHEDLKKSLYIISLKNETLFDRNLGKNAPSFLIIS